MLCRVLKRLIERGQTDGLAEKLDVFFAVDKLSRAEYDELREMLNAVITKNYRGGGA